MTFASEESDVFTTEKGGDTYVCISENDFREVTADLRTLEYYEDEYIPSLKQIIDEKEAAAQDAVDNAEKAIKSRDLWRGAAIAGGVGLIVYVTIDILVKNDS
jgi:hypothetical protein